jgi:HEAT repeat protein
MSAKDDPRTNEELLRAALTEEGEDPARDAIGVLHWRGSPDIFEATQQLCASADAHEREVGVDILGQLGYRDDAFQEEAVTILLGMLEHEQNPGVLGSIAAALGHRKDPRAIEPLTRLKSHPVEDVRFGVVLGLLTHEDEQAINTLIELSTDVASDVRDWATFGLGSMIESDTPEIRAALMARTTDEDGDTVGEAMVGLARRHDERVVDVILAERERGWYGSLLFEAAEEIADPRLYPTLVALWETWGDDKGWPFKILEDALKACQPRQED